MPPANPGKQPITAQVLLDRLMDEGALGSPSSPKDCRHLQVSGPFHWPWAKPFPATLFDGTEFLHEVDFEGVCFPHAMSFVGTHFCGDLMLADAHFKAACDFTEAVFHQGLHGFCLMGPDQPQPGINFTRITVHGMADFEGTSACNLDFSDARFLGPTDFDG